MDDEKKKVTEKEGVLGKPEEKSTLKKPTATTEKTDDGEENAEFDIFMSDLDDRLDNLFVDIEDMSVVEDTGPEPATALPDKEKERDELKITDAVKGKKVGDVPAKPQPPITISIDEEKIKEAFKKPDVAVIKKRAAPDTKPQKTAVYPPGKVPKAEKGKKNELNQKIDEKKAAGIKNVLKTNMEQKKDSVKPVAIDGSRIDKIEIIESFEISDSEKNQNRFYQNKFVLGGILIVLAVVVSFIIFKPFAGVEGDALQNTVTARKIEQVPEQLQIETVNPSSDTMIAKKAEPVVQQDTTTSQAIPEVKETEPLVVKEKDMLKAPTVSYPYSIHAESYRSLQSAELSAEAYRKTGLQAFWVRVDLGKKGVWYRVFIDCYKDLATAQEIIKEKQLKDANPIKIRYANFIGAYLSDDELTKQRRFLSERGYSPYFIQYENGINYLYTGAFDTLKEAENFSVNLSSRGIRSLVVER